MIYLIFAFVVSSWFMYFAVGFVYYSDVFFFFQAEDGIRDHCVTGVQTCALPISSSQSERKASLILRSRVRSLERNRFLASCCVMLEPPWTTELARTFSKIARDRPRMSMP